jgi:endonuclease YncB( thermonuclease family)
MQILRLVLALLPIAGPATAQTVTDGDTIKMAGTTYRLWGIEAPETHQTGADGWPAGRIAIEYLVNLMHGRTVTLPHLGVQLNVPAANPSPSEEDRGTAKKAAR